MAFRSQHGLGNRDYGFANEQVAKHPVAFEQPVHDYWIVIAGRSVHLHVTHLGKKRLGEDLIRTSAEPLALFSRKHVANDGCAVLVEVLQNRPIVRPGS